MKGRGGEADGFDPLPGEVEDVGGQVIGAAIEVHRHLGPGLLESVYEQAPAHELKLRGLTASRQVPVVVPYKGLEITGQRMDMIVEPGVIVELKAVEVILPIHEQQVLSYLKSTGFRLGLLINFNTDLLKKGIRRFVN